MEHTHTRIDEGSKRTQYSPALLRDEQTQRYIARITPEQRQAIIEDALIALTHGETTNSIGARHGVSGQSVRAWLLADDRADEARRIYFAQELAQARDDIQAACDPLALARAREDFRAIAWLAERRNPASWGQHNTVTVEHTGDLGEKLRRSRERQAIVIEHEPDVQVQQLPVQVIRSE